MFPDSQAFEVFVFTAGHSIYDNTRLSTLVGGFAVQFDGKLLNEVPLTIADQRFNQNPGVAVKPGTVSDGSGCLACHSHNLDDLPQATTPFPWQGSFYPTAPEKPPSSSTSLKTDTPENNKPQQPDIPKTGQPDKSVTGKDDKVTKTTEEKQPPKTTKKSTGRKTATTHKTVMRHKTKLKEIQTQIHEELRHQP